jgi:2-keto-3-deoxy-L-rhamnonate aldolase RhmA
MSQVAAEANDHVLLMPNLETVEAWRNIESIAAVDGCDLFFVGPADFSASMGRAGVWMPAEVEEKLPAMCSAVRSRGKHIGIIANTLEDERRRIDQEDSDVCFCACRKIDIVIAHAESAHCQEVFTVSQRIRIHTWKTCWPRPTSYRYIAPGIPQH